MVTISMKPNLPKIKFFNTDFSVNILFFKTDAFHLLNRDGVVCNIVTKPPEAGNKMSNSKPEFCLICFSTIHKVAPFINAKNNSTTDGSNVMGVINMKTSALLTCSLELKQFNKSKLTC